MAGIVGPAGAASGRRGVARTDSRGAGAGAAAGELGAVPAD